LVFASGFTGLRRRGGRRGSRQPQHQRPAAIKNPERGRGGGKFNILALKERSFKNKLKKTFGCELFSDQNILTSYVTIVHHVPLNEFLLYKNLLKFTFTPSYFSLLVYVKEKFICGAYDISGSAEKNLFASNDSVKENLW